MHDIDWDAGTITDDQGRAVPLSSVLLQARRLILQAIEPDILRVGHDVIFNGEGRIVFVRDLWIE